MPSGLLSILMPVYNEEEYVGAILERVVAAPLPAGFEREIIVVDDGSTDDSAAVVESMMRKYPGLIRLVRFERNRGKGAAVRRALEEARGEFSIIQDADLEYNPDEYGRILEPLVDDVADAVYGSRFANSSRRRVLYFWHSVANRVLTTLCNMAADLNLTDVETCYKAFRTSLVKTIPIRSDRFGIEPEITIKLAKRQARIYEVPISYEGRTYEDGKKIGVGDALAAVLVIFRNWLSRDLYTDPSAEILDEFAATPHFNRWMADTIAPFVGRRVLEIGAGMGNLSRQLAPRRARYIATDLDAEHLRRLRTRLHHRTNLETAVCDLANSAHFCALAGSVDTVVCLNVLEHVEDDGAALANIAQALEPGGRAIILVPNGPELFGRLDVVLGHYRRYSRAELERKIRAAGLQVERIIDFNRISRPGWLLKSRVLQRSRIGRLSLMLFERSVWLWRRIDHLLPWGPTSIIAIARKQVEQ
jgi:glycosyltransferase involved in cell wall biosynthesis/predicted RNA methylase